MERDYSDHSLIEKNQKENLLFNAIIDVITCDPLDK